MPPDNDPATKSGHARLPVEVGGSDDVGAVLGRDGGMDLANTDHDPSPPPAAQSVSIIMGHRHSATPGHWERA